MRIELDYKFENLNEMICLSRGNKYYANVHKKKEMEYIKWATLKCHKITEYPIKVQVIWHVKNRCFDLDNKVLKNILDGLVKAKILKNDNFNCINEINYKAVVDGTERVELILTKN